MLKNILKKLLMVFLVFLGFSYVNIAYGKNVYDGKYLDINVNYGTNGGNVGGAPEIGCDSLPGCKKGGGDIKGFLARIVDYFIQIVIALAVFALIFSGILYMISAGDEDKANRAKRWIIWSLIGVFLASSAWGIILLLNNIKF